MSALAESPDGCFQVNGDYVLPLTDNHVRQAILAAKMASAPAMPRQATTRAAMVVKVKRQRLLGPK